MITTWSQTDPKVISKWSRNDAKFKKDPKMHTNRYQKNDTRLQVCNCRQKQPRRSTKTAQEARPTSRQRMPNEGDRATGRELKVCNCKQKQAFEHIEAWWQCEKVNSFQARRSTTKNWFWAVMLFRGENAYSWWSMDVDILKSWFLWRKIIFIDADETWGRLP